MHDQHDLSLILDSRVPLVIVETHDESRFLEFLRGVVLGSVTQNYRPLFRWSVTDGLQRIDIDLEPQPTNADPEQVLRHIRSVDQPGIYVLLDFHPYIENPFHVRLLKDIAVQAEERRQTLILASHEIELPAELNHLAARFEMSLPDEKSRADIVRSVVNEWNKANAGQAQVDQKAFDLLIRNLAGLTRSDTERLARNAVYQDGAIAESDLPAVAKAKYELLNQDGVLSFEYETAKFSDVGGLSKLKTWLEQRKRVMESSSKGPKLDPPRGLLLLGIQGCGKSLAAKASAGILGLPLLRLDVGALYNKFHGETERNLRDSLQQAEIMAPCVLWIDEVEKGFATGEGDSGLSRRVLGTFLTWLAENEATVFVVATANDISQLPPELVRKGRFDEVFFVDLPSASVRLDIFKIHLHQRELNPEAFDLVRFVEASEGFSGAEIEQGIVAALYAARALRQDVESAHILAELKRSRPLSVLMAERLQELRVWAAERTVPAD
ncbi:MAG: AAA family ATPase [Gammaproteobacteria bacterium]